MALSYELKKYYKTYTLSSIVSLDKCEFTQSDFNNESKFTFNIDNNCKEIREIVFPEGLGKLLVDDSIGDDCKIEVIELPSTVNLTQTFKELIKIKSLLYIIIKPIERFKSRIHSLDFTVCSINSIGYPEDYIDSDNSNFESGYYNYLTNDVASITNIKKENIILYNDCYYYLKDNNYELLKARNLNEIKVEEEINGIKVNSIKGGSFDKFNGLILHIPSSINCYKDIISSNKNLKIDFYNKVNQCPVNEVGRLKNSNNVINSYNRIKNENIISCSFEEYTSCKYDYKTIKGFDDYKIEIIGSSCCIKKCNLTDEVIYIPESINGYKVTCLGERSFANLKNLKKVFMPDTVIEIKKSAFASCDKLDYVEFSKNIKDIAKNAFHNCLSLNELYIPNSSLNTEFYNCIKNYEHCIYKKPTKEYGEGFVTRIKNNSFFSRAKEADFYFEMEDEVIKGKQFDFECISFNYDFKLDYRNKNVYLSKEGYYYFLNENNEAILTHGIRNYNLADKQITLPSSLDGYPLVAIGNFAFQDAIFLDMHFPDSVKQIGYGAFASAIYNALYVSDSINMHYNACDTIGRFNIVGDHLISDLERKHNSLNYLNNLSKVIKISKENANSDSIVHYNNESGCSYNIVDNKAIIVNINHNINVNEIPAELDGVLVEGIYECVIKERINKSIPLILPSFITKVISGESDILTLKDYHNIVFPKHLKQLDLKIDYGEDKECFIVPDFVKKLNIYSAHCPVLVPYDSKIEITGDNEYILYGVDEVIKQDGINYILYKKENEKIAFAYSRERDVKVFHFVDEIKGYKVIGADLEISGDTFIFDYPNFDETNVVNLDVYEDLDDDESWDRLPIIQKYKEHDYYRSFHFDMDIAKEYRISGRIKKINNIRGLIYPVLNEFDEWTSYDEDRDCTIVLEEGIEEIVDFYSNEFAYKDPYMDSYIPFGDEKKHVVFPKSLKKVGNNALRYCKLDYITLYDTTELKEDSVDKWCKLKRINSTGFIKDNNRLEYVKKCINIWDIKECKDIINKINEHQIPEIKPIVIQMAKEVFETWSFENIYRGNKSIYVTEKSLSGEVHEVRIYDLGDKLMLNCGCRYATWYGCKHSLAFVMFVKEYYKELIYLCDNLTGFVRY